MGIYGYICIYIFGIYVYKWETQTILTILTPSADATLYFQAKLAQSHRQTIEFQLKQCLGTVNLKGLAHRCASPGVGPKWNVLRVLHFLRAPRATQNTCARAHNS